MKNKEGKEEPWKRGKVKTEKREGEMTNEVEKEKPSEKSQKRAKRAFEIFSEGFSFSTLLATPSSFFQVWPFLSFMVLPFSLYFSSLSSLSSTIIPFPLYCSCLSSLSSMALPFHLQCFLPSLPWFFLSLFILQAFHL